MHPGSSSVAILGGGVGGLSAAQELAERGFAVTVYEADDALGGKARSFEYEGDAEGPPLPGEHGFRFFPGFYTNLRDTMARIPLAEGGTVADNLVPTSETLVASVDGGESLSRSATPRTVSEWADALRPTIGNGELTARETNYFLRRLLVLLTSGRRRREREFDAITWWEFVDAEERSPAYRKHLAESTQALVAMRPQIASARTIGRIYVQLMLDQIEPRRPTEAVLNGPTSVVWIRPWVAYLRSLGVEFRTGTPVTAIESDGHRVTGVVVDGADGSETVTADHYVAAVPVEVMARLLTPALTRAAPSLAGVRKLDTAWMNGLQFYLTDDAPLAHGHQAYTDSPWALTSISQGQFWADGPFDLTGCADGSVQGVLSVIVSDWETPGVLFDKPASECTREEIVDEVWAQLTAHLNREDERLSAAALYDVVVDPAIVEAERGDRMDNQSPLLINTVGSLRHRPDAVTEAPNLVLAADYVRTETDLATMESANEAARRAVAGVLDRAGVGPPPTVWGLDEPAVFEPLRRQDDVACALGLPHPGETERGLGRLLREFRTRVGA
ncbi:hydroxysqualene dehydroxylase [Haloarcula pellucida]|uniref:Phytoene dehydrogenase n=1 Tax=Haloarcula pellucida TaxID=1427151 RepID=A0A830GK51_9EURY|nr:FAD-dependent oxidoreductase [Halomicroarcula pellucida]MBX0348920.1 FAD-dependent oxidoreductase [Halomicroarcula pellucida]GGN91233.1 phytoene dehydrogenase [Halomicroarcula pellucida]